MSSELGAPEENLRKWRFTWEAQSHIPTLRLLLFNPDVKPSSQCLHLSVKLALHQSLLTVSWLEVGEVEVALRVPIPRVLIDVDSPVNFRALDDHVEVKLSLLLPVDHPILSNFDSVLNLSGEDESCVRNASVDELQPLEMDYDVTSLSSQEGVHLYCRSCSAKLTRSLRFFKEMPSVNWREVADNWFGNCCCSFGGISEKLVTSYAKSYACATGVCLLSTTSVVLSKDDLVRCRSPDLDGGLEYQAELDFAGDNCSSKDMVDTGSKRQTVCFDTQSKIMQDFDKAQSFPSPSEDNLSAELQPGVIEEVTNDGSSYCVSRRLQVTKNLESDPGCCVDFKNCVMYQHTEHCKLDASEAPSPKEQNSRNIELPAYQKIFLNGFLGNVFMARSSNVSKDVQWIEFLCPQCSCLLGAFPCGSSHALLDSGVHLFKYCISTCAHDPGQNDFFRKYTLERMFTNQLLESAKDELSFRTVVRDLKSKCPMLQIVLLNPYLWCCSGYCFGTIEEGGKVDMYPIIKVLFSDCSVDTESQVRMIEEWVTKKQADEVYMLPSQIKELIISLELANNILPPSHTLLQGFSLSSMRR